MNSVVFTNPQTKYREEAFGGIACCNSRLYLLDRKYISVLRCLGRPQLYTRLSTTDQKIVKRLIADSLVLEIDEKRADALGNGKLWH